MNHGPLIFLAAFFALASSWFGLVLKPQMQVGHLQTTNAIGGSATYPLARSGLARQGLEVYRANGCVWCHTQQTTQQGTACDVVLTEAGTNQASLVAALALANPKTPESELRRLVATLPGSVINNVPKDVAERALKTLTASGAKGMVWIAPTGPDIARGWGRRRSVAEDFLYDDPVMPGSERIGPDLANVGTRLPDVNWHYRHLYFPRTVVKNSTMPPYRFLFQKRRIQGSPSPEALLTEGGHEIVPTEKGRALAAYLVSLRGDAPLFVAPFSVASAPAAQDTNAPTASGSTNSPGQPSATNAAPGSKQ